MTSKEKKRERKRELEEIMSLEAKGTGDTVYSGVYLDHVSVLKYSILCLHVTEPCLYRQNVFLSPLPLHATQVISSRKKLYRRDIGGELPDLS